MHPNTKIILLIEDNPGDARLIQEYLSAGEDNSYSLIWKKSLSEGKQYLKESIVDAVLLDLNLPDSVGKDTIFEMQLDMLCEPIIILSALEDEEAAMYAVHIGAQDYILKGEINAFKLKRAILFAIERKIYLKNFAKDYGKHSGSHTDTDKLFSIIAHDLRSPFHALMGLTELLDGDFDTLTKAEVKKYIHDLHEVTKNHHLFLENLLNWSLINSGKVNYRPRNVNLKKIVTEAASAVQLNAQVKNISVEIFIDEKYSLWGDERMLISAFQNLIGNSLKFSHRNGRIEITAIQREKFIVLRVKDNGIGMTHEQLQNIFNNNRLRTTLGTEKEKGSGFGLKLAQEFIEAHNGNISAESELGVGSIITVSLPLNHFNGSNGSSSHIQLNENEYVFG